MALGCSIRTLWEFYHLMICIYCAFLKDKNHKTLFLVVGKDSNNQIYLLVFNIDGKEEIEMWTLFIRGFYRCINNLPHLSIIVDRHNAINAVVANVFPNIHHGYCNQHIKCNMCVIYRKTKIVEGFVSMILMMLWGNSCG